MIIPPMKAEGITGVPLRQGKSIDRIVVIRLHAFGDTIITLPALAALRRAFPNTTLEFITSEEYVDLFSAFPWIDHVHSVTTRSSRFQRFRSAITISSRKTDLLLDLQRSRQSGLIRRRIAPFAWVAFDRFAPKPALERYLEAINFSGIPSITPEFTIPLPQKTSENVLKRFMLPTDNRPLICLNPAGCWETKNWLPERYVLLGKRLISEWNARILLLGTETVEKNASVIHHQLGDNVIDLVGKTTPLEAMVLVRSLQLMVSDDSGLMHVAWTNGIPTVGMFGASRRRWSRPYGSHTRSLGSEDLPCGACMSEVCSRNDRICLSRISVDEVMNLCTELLEERV